ncbi:hypothetical protein T7987_19225 (plasmid) [Sulfitobacter faviae]|uniref:DNA-binding protein n=1 Tax=Sulfitobacter faviae TaxID=1775881 RepID=A0ABZ0V6J5_9RHOB|nr:hypothetical protein [Sulfitobacter faviae]WPZ23954.1 hypothetical protein T7987_19225 [Sulfitobacter faviae]
MTFPHAGALDRAAQHRCEVFQQAGPFLSPQQTASVLGLSETGLEHLRARSVIIGVPIDDAWRYPAIQFQDAKPLHRLQDVLAAHYNIAEWVILDSLMAVDPAFGNRSIINLLEEKDDLSIDRVVSLLREQYAP